MRLLAALFAAVFLAFSAPVAANAPDNLRAVADLPGTVELVLVEEEGRELNGGFLRAGTYCVWILFCETVPDTIFIWAGPDVPEHLVLAVFLHEVGHYHQHLEGVLPLLGNADSEWDADRRAVHALCALGLNGPAVMADVVAWFWQDGYRGDAAHGDALDRINHSLALSCGGPAEPERSAP